MNLLCFSLFSEKEMKQVNGKYNILKKIGSGTCNITLNTSW